MKLNSIQALRAAAALLVLIYHTRAHEVLAMADNGLPGTPLFSVMIENGFAGVDLFFVISGFIMVYVTGMARSSLATSAGFLFARIVRIYPLWWLFASVMAVYFLLAYGLPYDAGRTVGGSQLMVEHPWLHLVYSYALLPQHSVPVHGLGWTLVHEMHFYLMFALLMLAPRRFLPWLLAGWALIVTTGSLSGLSSPHAKSYPALFFHPLSLEFIAGCYAALLVTSGRRLLPWAVFAAGAGGLILSLIIHVEDTAFTLAWGRVLWFGIPSALLIYGLASLEADDKIRLPAWLTAVGDWSYSLYLGHIFIVIALRRGFATVAGHLEGTPFAGWFMIGAPGILDGLFYYALCIALSLAFAWFTYRYFERPVMRQAHTWRQRLFAKSEAELKPVPLRAAIW